MAKASQDNIFWDHSRIMRLISLIQKYHVIWNKKHKNYYSKNIKATAYDAIANQLETTENKVRAKIKTMRSQWVKEFHKMEKQQDFKTTWIYFEHLKFLFAEKPTTQHTEKFFIENEDSIINYNNDDDRIENPQNFQNNIPQITYKVKKVERMDDIDVMKLLTLLRKNELLWDSKNTHYWSRIEREKAYTEIAKELDTTPTRIRTKIHTMRGQFKKELHKMETRKNYKPTWIYFNASKFMYSIEKYAEKEEVKKQLVRKTNFDNRWNSNQIIKFSYLLHENPVLWNKEHKFYKISYHRDAAYADLAKQMDTTPEKIRQKIHTMRSQCLKELQKMQQNSNYKPTWEYFDHIKFIYKMDDEYKKMIEQLEADKLLEDMIEETFDCENSDETETQISENESMDDNQVDEWEETYLESSNFLICEEKQKMLLDKLSNKDLTATKITEKDIVSDNDKENLNEFIMYGESIANELRLLKDFKTIQMELKCKIVRAVLEANEDMQKLLQKE